MTNNNTTAPDATLAPSGPLHSCPDCHTSPCDACDPEEQQ